jgi:hypothetical protein
VGWQKKATEDAEKPGIVTKLGGAKQAMIEGGAAHLMG